MLFEQTGRGRRRDHTSGYISLINVRWWSQYLWKTKYGYFIIHLKRQPHSHYIFFSVNLLQELLATWIVVKREKERSVFFVEADAEGMVTFSGNSSLQRYHIIIDQLSGVVRLQTVCLRIICNVARLEVSAGNSFIVRCHVTLKSPMRVRAVGKNFQLYNNLRY